MKINTDKNCNIIIHDDTEYPVNGIEYNSSISIYLVLINTAKLEDLQIIYNRIVNHKNTTEKDFRIEIKAEDYSQQAGYMTVAHIILPLEDPKSGPIDPDDDPYLKKIDFITESEINEILNNLDLQIPIRNVNTLNNNSNIVLESVTKLHYFSDGTNIYLRNTDGTYELISPSDWGILFEVNPEVFNLNIQILNFFSVCNLRNCYIALCLNIFDKQSIDRCFNNEKIDSQLIYKRDLVWAALNVIQYMIDNGQTFEAQRLYDRIMKCGNGLCSLRYVDGKIKDCGCSK